jgi:hypothetical protein
METLKRESLYEDSPYRTEHITVLCAVRSNGAQAGYPKECNLVPGLVGSRQRALIMATLLLSRKPLVDICGIQAEE